MYHSNAILAPDGRLKLAPSVVNHHWPLRRAAERFNVSVPTAARWAKRYVEHGAAGMQDRPSRPMSCPHRSAVRTEHRVVGLRTSKRLGAGQNCLSPSIEHLYGPPDPPPLPAHPCASWTVPPGRGSGRNAPAAMSMPGPVK